MTDELDRSLASLQERRRTRRAGQDAAFRAGVEQRLHNLEGDLAEVKNRINGLIFLVAGTVLTQVILRLLH